MKITFIRPNMFARKANDAMEPLVFAVLKSLTPDDIELELYDDRIEEIPEYIDTDIIAMTVETFTARRAYQLADKFRNKGIKVVMGGYHPTFLPTESLEHADSIFIGEAEGLWHLFLEDVRKGYLQKLYQQPKNISITNIEFDESIFANKSYLPIIPVQYGRGCKFNCEFCSISAFYGKEQKFRCLQKVRAELIRKRVKYAFIIDDNLFMDEKKAMELFKMLIPLKIKWGCQISIDIAKNEKLLKLMKKSGCISVLIGFESLNPKNLKLMGKSANLINDYQEAIKKIKEYGIMIYGTFIFGYDYDTADSFKLSLEFALKNKFFLANFNPLMPMPGTRLYQRLLKEDRLIYDKWWIDEVFSYGDAMFYPKNMTVRELEDGCFNNRREFNKYSNIAARALDFKSNLRNLSVYFGGNIVSRKEIYKKQGAKLGR